MCADCHLAPGRPDSELSRGLYPAMFPLRWWLQIEHALWMFHRFRRTADAAPTLRNPGSLRPWQHVLEPLAGYLWLGARLAGPDGERLAESWNFGPLPTDVRTVGELADAMLAHWGRPGWGDATRADAPHEAGLLRLAIDKAVGRLGWRPVWHFDETVARTAAWYRRIGDSPAEARAACEADLDAYCAAAAAQGLPFAD